CACAGSGPVWGVSPTLRPYVVVNVAATVDGKIDTVARRGVAISNEWDRDRVQRLRASVDAVMVGPRTLLDEDPRLTVRSPVLQAERVARGATPQPAKVSIVRSLADVRPDSRFLTDGPARVILFTNDASPRTFGDVEVHRLRDDGDRVDLARAMATLREIG